MEKLVVCMADGCEEIEALTVVDLLRESGISVDMVSMKPDTKVTGSHNIAFYADLTSDNANWSAYTGIILPGGPGAKTLKSNSYVTDTVIRCDKSDYLVAAICAGPTVLGSLGILDGKNATCYPGYESELTGAILKSEPVVIDGHIITSRGMGTAIPFALAIVSYLRGKKNADKLAQQIVFS